MIDRVEKTDAEWKAILTPDQSRGTRHGGTECAFTGALWNNHDEGTFACVCCGQPLFQSGAKFESGTGWPSFWQPVDEHAIKYIRDSSHGMVRTEVQCAR